MYTHIEVTRENCYVGAKVTRNPDDWPYRDQDGGEGHIGIITEWLGGIDCIVVWPNGQRAGYEIERHHHLQMAVPEKLQKDEKFPEPNNYLIGRRIKIFDNQGMSILKVGEMYPVERYDKGGFIIIVIGEKEVRWRCNGNKSGRYFELIHEELIQKEIDL